MVAASFGSFISQVLWNSLDCCKSSMNWSSHAVPATAHSDQSTDQPWFPIRKPLVLVCQGPALVGGRALAVPTEEPRNNL